MTRCCAVYCNRIGTFLFPKNVSLRKKWEKAINKKNFTANATSKLCAAHFKKTDFKKSVRVGVPHTKLMLKPNAVPSLFKNSLRKKPKQLLPKVFVKEEKVENGENCAEIEDTKINSNSDTLKCKEIKENGIVNNNVLLEDSKVTLENYLEVMSIPYPICEKCFYAKYAKHPVS